MGEHIYSSYDKIKEFEKLLDECIENGLMRADGDYGALYTGEKFVAFDGKCCTVGWASVFFDRPPHAIEQELDSLEGAYGSEDIEYINDKGEFVDAKTIIVDVLTKLYEKNSG